MKIIFCLNCMMVLLEVILEKKLLPIKYYEWGITSKKCSKMILHMQENVNSSKNYLGVKRKLHFLSKLFELRVLFYN
jgi:hypothetical protein